ncbi:hypothetical protein ABT173_48175 [Streptomyces sp. NPDC001795]|uniref:hypothetical protein n=1 Tax=unclassified Streptomyces TaxID=2593676 RepID=UPI003324E299
MRAKQLFLLLGPGLVVSLVVSPSLASHASAAPAPALTAAPSSHYVEPTPPSPYQAGYSAGEAAEAAGKPISAAPIPSAQGHTVDEFKYYAGWRSGWQNAALYGGPGSSALQAIMKPGIEEIQKIRQAQGMRIQQLLKEQPQLPAVTAQGQQTGEQQVPTEPTTPTHQTGQEATPQGQETSSPQGPTESTTPTYQAGQEATPQGQETSSPQGPTESTTPTHETGQGETPQGQDQSQDAGSPQGGAEQ